MLNYELISVAKKDNVLASDGKTSLNGVITKLILNVSLTDGDFSIHYPFNLPAPDVDSFTAIESLSKANIINWVESLISEKSKDNLIELISRISNQPPGSIEIIDADQFA